jgi:hypothetical protein
VTGPLNITRGIKSRERRLQEKCIKLS